MNPSRWPVDGEHGQLVNSVARQTIESFERELFNSLARLELPSTRILVGVSGGPDSVALVSAWSRLADQRRDELVIAHFNHELRVGAGADAEWVERLARELGREFHGGAPAVPISKMGGASLEGAARAARYDFFDQAAQALGVGYVAVAHTFDDQVETVLAALLRGTGLKGLAGMPPARPLPSGAVLIRPLLGLRRSDVEAYLSARDIPARLDPTNLDRSLTRNRIRHELLPMLRREFQPRVDEAIVRLAAHSAAAIEVIHPLVETLLARSLLAAEDDRLEWDVAVLSAEPPFLQAEAIKLGFEKHGWPRRQLGDDQLQTILQCLRGPRCRAQIPGPIDIERRGNRLALTRSPST